MSEGAKVDQEQLNGDSKIQIEKAKKNLVYVGIFSVIMLFGGFTSAYIVSMGDSFWLKIPLPPAFWISTVLIVISSVVFQAAVMMVKKGNLGGLKIAVSLTFLLGLGFVYYQFQGYGQLVENGVHATGSNIIVSEGKYGDYFHVKMDDEVVFVNGNDYLLKGKKMTDQQMKDLQSFTAQFLSVDEEKPFTPKSYGDRFILYYDNMEMVFKDGVLFAPDSTEFQYIDRIRLMQLAANIRDGRGDFFVRGEMGKDFHVYFKGEELHYEDRVLKKDGQPLSGYLQLKAMESADTASSYLYIITFLHLLHIMITLLYMARVVIRSFTGKINQENNIGLRVGAIFWHFLGILWLYLLLFLLFIH
jgi:cytochrome c oxidase subunit 3